MALRARASVLGVGRNRCGRRPQRLRRTSDQERILESELYRFVRFYDLVRTLAQAGLRLGGVRSRFLLLTENSRSDPACGVDWKPRLCGGLKIRDLTPPGGVPRLAEWKIEI